MNNPENTEKPNKDDQEKPEESMDSKETKPDSDKKGPTPIPKMTEDKGRGPNLRQVGKKMPLGPGNFWNNMLSTVLLLIFVTALFSYLTENKTVPEELTITDVVEQVKAGEVKTIVVRGAILEVSYTDDTKNPGEAKREVDASVTESLTNLGVTA